MNKEEFLNVLEVELKKAEVEFNNANKREEYYGYIDKENDDEFNIGLLESDEYLKAKYLKKIYSKRIELLKAFKKYVDYVKIQEMNDEEILEYKNNLLHDLKQQIEQCKNDKENEIARLKKEEEENIELFSNASLKEKQSLIVKGKDIISKINSYSKSSDLKIENLKIEYDKITNMTIEEFRIYALKNIDQNNYFSHMDKNVNTLDLLMSSIAFDFRKVTRMSNLLTEYSKTFNKKDDNRLDFNILVNDSSIPEMEEIFKKLGYEYENRNKDFINYFEQYKKEFYSCEEEFYNYFIWIKDIIDYRYINIGSPKEDLKYYNDNFYIYEKYENLEKDYLGDFKKTLEETINLSKKIFKTNKTKEKIRNKCCNLNTNLSELKYCICKGLSLKLEKYKDIFGLEDVSNFFGKSAVKKNEHGNILYYYFDYIEYNTLELKIKNIFRQINNRRELIENVDKEIRYLQKFTKSLREKTEIESEMKKLGGDRFINENIIFHPISEESNKNEDYIIERANLVYLYNLIREYFKVSEYNINLESNKHK